MKNEDTEFPQATSPDRRRRPERKVEILQAVMALLETGEKVTTAALAGRLGLSEAALYRHFRGKTAIFAALADYVEDHLMRPVNKLLTVEEPAMVRLEKLFAYHLQFLGEHPGLCRVFLVEGVTHETPEIRARMALILRKYTAQVKQILRMGQAAGEIPPLVPATVAAQLFVGILQSRALNYVLGEFRHPPQQGAADVWLLYERAVGVGEPLP